MKKNKKTQRQKQIAAKKGLKRKKREKKVNELKIKSKLRNIKIKKEIQKKQEEELMKILNSRES